MQTKVEICGINTSKLKVLKNEETMELIRRTQAGDQKAKDAAVMGNLRLVLSVVQRFSSRGEPMDDLFQVGVIGLLKAIENFDTSREEIRFSTYGVPMIVGENPKVSSGWQQGKNQPQHPRQCLPGTDSQGETDRSKTT